jgi:hypothetical protein
LEAWRAHGRCAEMPMLADGGGGKAE